MDRYIYIYFVYINILVKSLCGMLVDKLIGK